MHPYGQMFMVIKCLMIVYGVVLVLNLAVGVYKQHTWDLIQ